MRIFCKALHTLVQLGVHIVHLPFNPLHNSPMRVGCTVELVWNLRFSHHLRPSLLLQQHRRLTEEASTGTTNSVIEGLG